MAKDVYIALGSNQGDRELNLLRSIAEIGKLPGTRITALSGFYDTEPVGAAGQDNYLNAVLQMETSLPPRQLLQELQRIEAEVFHRVRTTRWGPRTVDLDILFYDAQVIEETELTLPHPRLHERRFVLAPLVEIAGNFIHPLIGKSIACILAELPAGERVTRID